MKRLWIFLLTLALLAGCGASGTAQETEAPEEHWAKIPMVMLEGELYLTTGYQGLYRTDTAGPEFWDGEILATVPAHETPTEDGQANCAEVGTGWRWGEREGTVELLINKNWIIFATEETRAAMHADALAQ